MVLSARALELNQLLSMQMRLELTLAVPEVLEIGRLVLPQVACNHGSRTDASSSVHF